MLLCDNCSLAFHLNCIDLVKIPQGNFYCHQCEEQILFKNIKQEKVDPT